MTLQWAFVIIAAWAVVISLASLVLYAAIVRSGRISQQESEQADESPSPTGGIGPAQTGDGE